MKTLTIRCSELCWIEHKINITPETFEDYKIGDGECFWRRGPFEEAAQDLTFDRFINIYKGKEPDIAYVDNDNSIKYVVATIMDNIYEACWDAEGDIGDACDTDYSVEINE